MRATPLPAFKQARRGSNPQPPVLETGALPVELRTSDIQSGAIYSAYTTQSFSGQGRNRTTDTTIFSRVLYQLSYLARYLARYFREKKYARAFRRRAARRGVRAPVVLEAPLDGPPPRARPRVRHRPSPGLLCIGPEH
jgi:hypothetical protein